VEPLHLSKARLVDLCLQTAFSNQRAAGGDMPNLGLHATAPECHINGRSREFTFSYSTTEMGSTAASRKAPHSRRLAAIRQFPKAAGQL
jgi:hypothetical protein